MVPPYRRGVVADESVSTLEFQRRLVFSLLKPAVRLARRFRLPLKDFEHLCRLACFEEYRRRGGLSHADLSRTFGLSLRTIGNLERAYRADFFAPERELAQRRRVEDALRAGHATVAAVADVVKVDAAEAERLLEVLVAGGRVQRDGSPGEAARYRLDPAYRNLMRADLDARVDGVNHQLDVMFETLRCRLLGDDGPALGRTLSFQGRDEDVAAMAETLVRALRAACGDVDDRAQEHGGDRAFAVTLALAPVGEDER